MLHFCMKSLADVGSFAREQCRGLQYLAAVLGTVLLVGIQPGHWRRTVRQVFARQVFLTGVKSLRFIFAVAILVGILVVVQIQLWVGKVGHTQLLGPLLVVVVARELGPLFANFVAIVNGGSTMTTELGIMKFSGEVRALEAQGIDPFVFLVMPRVMAMAVSALCLTVFFIVGAFGSGYAFGALMGITHLDLTSFLASVFKSIRPVDVVNILTKSILPAMVTSAICSTEGLGVVATLTDVPLATKRSLGRSLLALFVITAVISLLTYW